MLKYINKVTGLVLGLSMMTSSIISGVQVSELETIYEQSISQDIAKGLSYEHKEKLTEDGWVDIHVIKADLKEESLNLEVMRDSEVYGQREGVSDMANEGKVFVGGINASFFSIGTSLSDIDGIEIIDGDYGFIKDQYNTSVSRAASLIYTDDKDVSFDFISTDISFVTSTGVDIYVVGINSIGNFDNPVVFNTKAYQDTSSIDTMSQLYKVVVEDNAITEILPPNEVAVIPENGYVLVMNEIMGPQITAVLNKGLEVSLSVESNYDVESIKMAISGGGMILKDGQVVDDGLVVGKNARHPRTVVGLTQDGETLISMVVDGRGQSLGATHEEVASYLLEYGVYNAIHMDGGGSSTLSARELGGFEVSSFNTPSDGYERPVVNGLGFVSTAPVTSEYKLLLKSNQKRSFINSKIKLELKAYDDNYNPVEINEGKISWGISGGYGTIEDMIFIPQQAGDVMLTAYYQGRSTTIELDISDELIDLEVIPKVISYEDGQQTFTVVGTDTMGYKSVIDNTLLTWSLTDDIGSIDTNGTFIGNGLGADARIDVTYKGIKEIAYIVSGVDTYPIIDMDTQEVETLVYPESVKGNAQIIDGEKGKTMSIAYDFLSSSAAQAVYGVLEGVSISKPIDRIRLNAKGHIPEIAIKGHIEDATQEQFGVTFIEKEDGVFEGVIPSNIAYPIKLTRIYTVAISLEEAMSGVVNIDSVESIRKAKVSDYDHVESIEPVDPLYNNFPEEGFEIRIFGATSGRNRLLDEIVLDKAFTVLNEGDYAIYAGSSEIDGDKVLNSHLVCDETFKSVDLADARIITLGMAEGSLVKSDASQWKKLNDALASTAQGTIVVIGTQKLLGNGNSKFSKEGQLIHDTLSAFEAKSAKKIFYVNASGYDSKLDFEEGIRYIDLNGLWYRKGDHNEVDLYDSFQTLNITFSGDDVTYQISDLYPKTTIQKQ